jgi:hypothetical protein
MRTDWIVTAAANRVELDAGNHGVVTFTVTNPDATPDRMAIKAHGSGGAQNSWFSVDRPQQTVPGGASVTYLARSAVPAGTPAVGYRAQSKLYSADSAPEDGEGTSGRAAFDAKASQAPKRATWPYAAAVALVLAVLGMIGFVVSTRMGSAGQGATPEPPPGPSPSRPTPRNAFAVAVYEAPLQTASHSR